MSKVGVYPEFFDYVSLDLNLTQWGLQVPDNTTLKLKLSSKFNVDTSGMTQYTTNA